MNDVIDQSYKLIEPFIEKVKAKSYQIKMQLYLGLPDYEKALFSFHVLYQHAKKNVESFLYYTETYISIGFWDEIIKGIKYFNNGECAIYFEKVKLAFEKNELENEYFNFMRMCKNHLVIINAEDKSDSHN
jgi:hypothetical protein